MLGWFKKIGLVFFFGVLLSGCARSIASGETDSVNSVTENQSAEISEQPKLAMIIGTPSKVKFAGDIIPTEEDLENETINLAGWFELRFRSFDVLFGEMEKKKLKLYVTALHAEYFTNFGDVIVFLDVSDQNNPKAIWWELPDEMVCISKGIFEGIREKYGGPATRAFFEDFKDLGRNTCDYTGR